MWNPLDIFPKHMDSNIQLMLIFLVVIQFVAFVIWMVYLFSQYLEVRKKNREATLEGNVKKTEEVKQD